MSQRAPKDAPDASAGFGQWPFLGTNSAVEYWVDAWQRSVLLLDVLRQRGNNCVEHNARKAPHVLSFEAELVLDGRSLASPVNYALVRIVPPAAPGSSGASGRLSSLTHVPGTVRGSAA